MEQTFQTALRHQQSGDVRQAQALYQQILATDPNHIQSLHMLGVLSLQLGQLEDGLRLLRRAAELEPQSPMIHNNLGNAFHMLGRPDDAISSYRRAIGLQPDFASAYNNLGSALKAARQMDAAIMAYQKAAELDPRFVQARFNLAITCRDLGRFDETISFLESVLVLSPNYPDAHRHLTHSLVKTGRFCDAIKAAQHALSANPQDSETLMNLGVSLREIGRLPEAIDACERAVAIAPNSATAILALGNAFLANEQFDEAAAIYLRVLEIDPGVADAHVNLGSIARLHGKLDEAIASYARALQVNPRAMAAHINLAVTLARAGQVAEAVAVYREAQRIDPFFPLHNFLFSLHYSPDETPQSIFEEHRKWGLRFTESRKPFLDPFTNARTSDRPIRIGYVSSDFREHAVGRNLLPLFRKHDRQHFHITCYSNSPKGDALTTFFQSHSDRWRSIVGLSDIQAAQLVCDDQIDILVDLALHSAGNRLGVFAHKPAPIQVTFAGYPATTGLPSIDYRITDPYLDPPGLNDQFYTEECVYLPGSFWCYEPAVPDISVNSLPLAKNGYVTFGCLNHTRKMNEPTFKLWSRVLRALRDSRLLLLVPPGMRRQQIVDSLAIAPARVEFAEFSPQPLYLELYHRIDICLDTFPYNGHTTSLDAMWMGVPVISLAGQSAVSRAGLSQMSAIGLPELVASSPDQFVDIAVSLAKDPSRLATLHANLRTRMEHSVLMDAIQFARSVESAYCTIWKKP